jgi:hypothetical protein
MSTQAPGSAPSPRRGIEAFFIVTFVAFALTSFLFDRTGAIDNIAPDSSDPFARALYWYAVKYDPLLVANPLFLQVMSAISAFVFGPLYLVLAWGLYQRRPWFRTPAVVWAWTMLYSMSVHVAVELWGDHPPPNLLVFTAIYAMYALFPALLLLHLRKRT